MNENGSVKASELKLNYEYELLIRTSVSGGSGGGVTENFSPVAAGFDNITEAINEVVSQFSFLADKGWGSTYVTGGQYIFTLSGYRVVGDTAQDYIFSNETYGAFGKARESKIKITTPDGLIIECPVTLAKITRSGGASNSPTAVSVEIHTNGKPTATKASEISD